MGPGALKAWRQARLNPGPPVNPRNLARGGEFRTPFQKDRDRILYSGAFRRLAEITQVASPQRGYIIHNRLTHVLKVAQVARRLAETLVQKTKTADIHKGFGLDPDVVETAALAHDLGHPPFGHLAEEELDHALMARGLSDGFEGNAQTFRIVTKLESRGFSVQEKPEPFFGGLNLTRASLNAIIKYPWSRQRRGKGNLKWNVYDTELEVFNFAREQIKSEVPTLEAQIMDWSDDLAYGVHDFEDFYRSGIIPVAELMRSEDVRNKFIQSAFIRCSLKSLKDQGEFESAAQTLFDEFPFVGPYEGTLTDRALLKSFSNSIINSFMKHTRIKDGKVKRPEDLESRIKVLTQLTWHYVIEGPDLALEQIGHREILRCVLKTFIGHAQENDLSIFSPRYKYSLERLHATRRQLDAVTDKKEIAGIDNEILRIASDIIAHMSEKEILTIHSKVKG
jgi:dGTPase